MKHFDKYSLAMKKLPFHRILITQAQPGMVLAQPVTDSKGVALCNTGTRLDEELIHRLLMRAILHVWVLGQSQQGINNKDEQRLQQLDERFSRIQGHEPLMNAIRDLVRDKLSRRTNLL